MVWASFTRTSKRGLRSSLTDCRSGSSAQAVQNLNTKEGSHRVPRSGHVSVLPPASSNRTGEQSQGSIKAGIASRALLHLQQIATDSKDQTMCFPHQSLVTGQWLEMA